MRREDRVEAVQAAPDRRAGRGRRRRAPAAARRQSLLEQLAAVHAQARPDEQRANAIIVEAALQPLDHRRGHIWHIGVRANAHVPGPGAICSSGAQRDRPRHRTAHAMDHPARIFVAAGLERR